MKGVFIFAVVCLAVAMACEHDNQCHGCPAGQVGFCNAHGRCECRDDPVGRRQAHECSQHDPVWCSHHFHCGPDEQAVCDTNANRCICVHAAG